MATTPWPGRGLIMMADHLILLCPMLRAEVEQMDRHDLPPDAVDILHFDARCEDRRHYRKALPGCIDIDDYRRVDILSGPCLAGADDGVSGEHPVRLHRNVTCFDLLLNPTTVQAYIKDGHYLLSPGWLASWRTRLASWGFDEESARAFFGELPGDLLMVDTGVDPRAHTALSRMAAYVGKGKRDVSVGTDYLLTRLRALFLEGRIEGMARDSEQRLLESSQRLSHYAMGLDFVRQIAASQEESEIQRYIVDMFRMFFAPREVTFHEPDGEHANVPAEKTSDGFRLPVRWKDRVFGLVEVAGLAHPEYRDRYLEVGEVLLQVCALAISNARHYATIRHLAQTDGLTGVANRRQFDAFLHRSWERARADGTPLAVLLCDLDNFKEYNDTMGHAMGDECLKRVASAIETKCLRPTDLLGRYGGEEFGVVLPGADPDAARAVASRIRRAVADLEIPHGSSPISRNVTISVGAFASVPEDNLSPAFFVQMADKALYQAKKAGRNRVDFIEA